MERHELGELHYITHVENMRSIGELGILSHRKARRIAHRDVSLAEVQDRRKGVRVPNGLLLHDYANLYVTARNPMLFLRLQQGYCDDLCVVAVSPDILDLPNVVITDRNAAATYCRFRSVDEGLVEVDAERVACRYWPHDDPLEEERRRNAKFTEILVPGEVEPHNLQRIYVGSPVAKTAVAKAGIGLEVATNHDLFFNF